VRKSFGITVLAAVLTAIIAYVSASAQRLPPQQPTAAEVLYDTGVAVVLAREDNKDYFIMVDKDLAARSKKYAECPSPTSMAR